MKTLDYVINELKNYVRKEEFAPVKSLVYGLAGLILTAFIVALTTLVFKK